MAAQTGMQPQTLVHAPDNIAYCGCHAAGTTSLTKVRRLTGASGLSLVMTLILVERAAKILGMTTVPHQVPPAALTHQRAHSWFFTEPCTVRKSDIHLHSRCTGIDIVAA